MITISQKEMDVTAFIEFKGELVELVSRQSPGGNLEYPVDRRASVKDVIESLGVPHAEVYRIGVNGTAIGFDWLLEPGARVEVEPVCEPVDVTLPTLLRPDPFPGLKFIVDENVARLASLLRMVGMDASYDRSWDDKMIADMAYNEKRVVLSRDRALLKRAKVTYGRLIRSVRPWGQLAEVLEVFNIDGMILPGTRCIRCNLLLEDVDKAHVLHLLEPKTKKYFNTFKRCVGCGRVYWRGSHHRHMACELDRLGLGVG